jgi:hypothetical protein
MDLVAANFRLHFQNNMENVENHKCNTYTGCLMKNASTHNFVIYYPISMIKKIKNMVFQALQNSHKKVFFGVIFNS